MKEARSSESQMISDLAEILDQAQRGAYEVPRLTLKYPDLTLEQGYLIQDEVMKNRKQRGETQVGFKMGFTSQAKRDQMKLGSPIYGILTDQTRMEARSHMSLEGLIHPKIEPEIAFVMEKEIRGIPSVDQALDAVAYVCCALEILDSRFKDFKYFSLPDVVADNCSASRFILGGEQVKPKGLKLAELKMVMRSNGEIAEQAMSSEISGNPVNSLIQLCELLTGRGLILPAGSIVLGGAATQAIPLKNGMKVSMEISQIGELWIQA